MKTRAATALGPIVTAAATVIIGVPALRNAGPPQDEGLLLVYPELVLRGFVPNRDFLLNYGPGDIWFLAGVSAFTGASLLVERFVGLLFHVAIATALYALMRPWGIRLATAAGILAAVVLIQLDDAAYAWLGAVALVLWALWCASGEGVARGACGGTLAGAAVLFRPELAPVVIVALAPLAVGRGRPTRAAMGAGFVATLVPLAFHVLVVGIGTIAEDLFAGVPGRYLPLPGAYSALLAVNLVAAGGLVAMAALAVRREGSERGRALLAVALFAVASQPQALQRSDLYHLASAGAVPIALLPITISMLAAPLSRRVGPGRLQLASVLVTVMLLAVAGPVLIVRVATVDLPRAIGLVPVAPVAVEHAGRVWYPADARDASAVAKAADLRATIDEVERLAVPNARLFVGPRDLRRTSYNDTFLYYLLPRFVPASYYLEMTPGVANGPGSRLADDIASADVLVLTSAYDSWSEPNASAQYGDDRPNEVVRTGFTLRAMHGVYAVYSRASSP